VIITDEDRKILYSDETDNYRVRPEPAPGTAFIKKDCWNSPLDLFLKIIPGMTQTPRFAQGVPQHVFNLGVDAAQLVI